jgi:ribonuclease HII
VTQIIGVDEVGRGPLAGPVLAVAVILDPKKPVFDLADSKKLSEKKRILLNHEIRQSALRWAFGIATVIEIDKVNILQASLLAMSRAVAFLRVQGDYQVMVDGNQCPKVALPVTAIIKGDSLIPEISAASIVAKVIRDNLMNVFAKKYPQYGLEQHKGYPTKIHLAALKQFGITPLHRKSFGPVKALLES